TSSKMSSNAIAKLNDNLRGNIFAPSPNMVCFAGDVVHEPDKHFALMVKVFRYRDFNTDNDPAGEHDMGFFRHDGEDFMWKIDCYDQDMKFASPDPADPKVSIRVLTIFKARDY